MTLDKNLPTFQNCNLFGLLRIRDGGAPVADWIRWPAGGAQVDQVGLLSSWGCGGGGVALSLLGGILGVLGLEREITLISSEGILQVLSNLS